jgi:hypothetical protein
MPAITKEDVVDARHGFQSRFFRAIPAPYHHALSRPSKIKAKAKSPTDVDYPSELDCESHTSLTGAATAKFERLMATKSSNPRG